MYLKGKKTFWIFAVEIILLRVLEYIAAQKTDFYSFVWEALFLVLLYRGYVWVWYLNVVRLGFMFVTAIILAVIIIPQLYWMIQVYPPLQMFFETIELVMIVVVAVTLVVKRDLKYFVKMQQLKRKGKLDDQQLQEMEDIKK